MVKQDKLNALRLFLDKLNTTGTVNRGDVLSLESAIETAIYTSKKDIVYLSPSSACIGVDEVKSMVENEIKKTESEVFITYTQYIQRVRELKDLLCLFKEKILDSYGSLPKSVLDLINKEEYRLTWVHDVTQPDGPEGKIVYDMIQDTNNLGIFNFFEQYDEHLRAICELNPEKATEIYNNIKLEIEAFKRDMNSSSTDGNLQNPIFHIFNILQVDLSNYEYDDLFKLTDELPINIFTIAEFHKTYFKLGVMKQNIDVINNLLENTIRSNVLEYISQDRLRALVNVIDTLTTSANNPRIMLFGHICKLLSKI